MKLVVVESPGKVKKVQSFLPAGYRVVASYGHVRDLPDRDLGIEFRPDGVRPVYVTPRKSLGYVKRLKSAASGVDEVLLATDPDREGEAIAWHVQNVLRDSGARFSRVEFHEITRGAVNRAIANPRQLDLDRVNAQQARRLLDRLVGWLVSPVCWTAVKGARSAGRVQSVAVRIVCDREEEIEAFRPEVYFNLFAMLSDSPLTAPCEVPAPILLAAAATEARVPFGQDADPPPPAPSGTFPARLVALDGREVARTITSLATADTLRRALAEASWRVVSVDTSRQSRRPPPPFITSTLQQAASNRLKWPPRRTAKVAQSLYEAGLITYIRTDSPSIAPEAVTGARAFIEDTFGAAALPERPRYYRASSGAQEAHECIRPTDVRTTPADLRMTGDGARLYRLIWERFVACQMRDALNDVTTAVIAASLGPTASREARAATFEAKGTVPVELGWLALTARDDAHEDESESGRTLPPLAAHQLLHCARLDAKQATTRPPARYTQASLIRALEKEGVGRPATYASIMETILARKYVAEEKRVLAPTPLGRALNLLLKQGFAGHFIEVGFTRDVEAQLDRVADGATDWQKLVETFRDDIDRNVASAPSRISIPDDLLRAAEAMAPPGATRGRASKRDPARKKRSTPRPLAEIGRAKRTSASSKPPSWLTRRDSAAQAPNPPSPAPSNSETPMDERSSTYARPGGTSTRSPRPPRRDAEQEPPYRTNRDDRRDDRHGEVKREAPRPRAQRAPAAPQRSDAPAQRSYGGRTRTEPPQRRNAPRPSQQGPVDQPGEGLGGPRPRPRLRNDVQCPECGAPMVERVSSYGPFLGCSNFPKCRGTRKMH